MKSGQHMPKVLIGTIAFGVVSFAWYQVTTSLFATPPSSSDLSQTNRPTNPTAATTVQFPTVTTDPFLPIETPIVIEQTPPNAVASGPGTTMSESSSVTTSVGATPLQGPIGELPDPSNSTTQGETSSAPTPRATLEFKGVIEAGEPLAYISINGERARPFRLGTQISQTVTLTGITHSHVTMLINDKEVRIRTGQEVEIK